MNLPISPTKKKIRTNKLLKGPGPKMSLNDILKLKQVMDTIEVKDDATKAKISDSSILANISQLSVDDIIRIHEKFGEEGLFKLQYLMSAHNNYDFSHFYEVISGELAFSEFHDHQEPIELDNKALLPDKKINDFNTHVMQPSLSRKLYNPGRHHGYFVYGIGGPKILVSHPYQGIDGKAEVYDLYNNSVDVVTSLMIRGYYGSFMFLDFMPGLNYAIKGIPAWVIWFSVIATHSDLVIFVKESEDGFSSAQNMEVTYTSDRVQKKIVEIPHKELKWAKQKQVDFEGHMYIGEKGSMTQEEWYKMEREHAEPFINNFVATGIPKDRLITISEDSELAEYPLNYPMYDY